VQSAAALRYGYLSPPNVGVITALLAVSAAARAAGGEAPRLAAPEAPLRAAADGDAPRPAILDGKRHLDAEDLAHKVEGTYLTGLPIIDSDPDTGFGVGAFGYMYWDGPRSDPFFAYTPYRHRLAAQVFVTTNGYQYHSLDYDAPYLGGSPLRLRATLYYEKNIAANYFGRGEATLGHLGFSGVPHTFGAFDAYTAALRQVRADGIAYTLYDKFWVEDPGATATLERDLFGGIMRIQGGFWVSHYAVRDYSGAATNGDDPVSGATDVAATMGVTRLRGDCDAGRILGCGGGFDNVLKLGIALDTRDYEPDPNSGVFVDFATEVSSRALGSSFDYVRATLSPRVFVSPFPRFADLVLAGRGLLSAQTAGTPFFTMDRLALTDGDRIGLGGLRTLRGFKQDRFVGAIAALANVELRWTFVHFDALAQHFALMAVPFVDAGRVFDRVSDFALTRYRWDAGGGLRVAWNKATLLLIDYGMSAEDSALFMDFGHEF
jgi:outer membrane protein assembly factor BamA